MCRKLTMLAQRVHQCRYITGSAGTTQENGTASPASGPRPERVQNCEPSDTPSTKHARPR